MVAHNRLHDREAETCAVWLAGVVRRKQLRGFFRRQATAGISNLDSHRSCLLLCAYCEAASTGHGFNGVQNQIREHAVQEFRIGHDGVAG